MISSRRQSRSFVTLQINSRRHDYLPGISVLMHVMKELNVARVDIQAIGKISPLVTPLGGKVFWVYPIMPKHLYMLITKILGALLVATASGPLNSYKNFHQDWTKND